MLTLKTQIFPQTKRPIDSYLSCLCSYVKVRKRARKIHLGQNAYLQTKHTLLLVSKISLLEEVPKKIESLKKQKQVLNNLLKTSKISQTTYDRFAKELDALMAEVKAQREALVKKAASKIDNLKKLVYLLETCLADLQFRYSIGKIDKEHYSNEIYKFDSGLKAVKKEMQNLENALKELQEKKAEVVEPGKGFHFYEGVGKPLNQIAFSFQDFLEKVKTVPIASIEFHQNRGDFSNWIRDILHNAPLAEAIKNIKGTGEAVRRQLIGTMTGKPMEPERVKLAKCPKCGTEVSPLKTWKMAGRPDRMGERPQLTIGHYKCPNCHKTFRQVLAKEKIRTPK